MDMPQKEDYENHNLWMKTAKEAYHSCYRGVAKFDSPLSLDSLSLAAL
jgi:hypothetical protein